MVKVNSSSINGKVSRALSRRLVPLMGKMQEFNNSSMKAVAGIRGKYAIIMGVNNFGDPLHTFPNTKNEEPLRYIGKQVGLKGIKKLKVDKDLGVKIRPIPARPFLTTAQTIYKVRNYKYLEKAIPALLAGFEGSSGKKVMTPKAFYEGLSENMAQNIRDNWNSGNFVANSPATLANKSDDRPLHGKKFSDEKIKGWVKND